MPVNVSEHECQSSINRTSKEGQGIYAAGGTWVREMLTEMPSVSFVWKMTYKWRYIRRHVPSSLLQHLWLFRKPHSVKTPEGGRKGRRMLQLRSQVAGSQIEQLGR